MNNQSPRYRHSLRLKGYDYRREGMYFVTVCVQDRECLFGQIEQGQMQLNAAGQLVQTVWQHMPRYYDGVEIDQFIVMPNHIHAIVCLVGAGPRACPAPEQTNAAKTETGQPQGVAPTLSLSDVMHRFKTFTTGRYIDGVKTLNWPSFRGRLWQRNYYENIIRSETSLASIRAYIQNNPAQWAQDEENPLNRVKI